MAVYTVLDRRTIQTLVQTYDLGILSKVTGVPAGSVNTHYLLHTSKGAFFLKIDEVKSASQARSEVALLRFLQAAGFPCPQPLADRQGRYVRGYDGKTLSVYPRLPGRAYMETALTPALLQHTGYTLARLHRIGQHYRPHLANRFDRAHVATLYQDIRAKIPPSRKRLLRVLDDEVAYQHARQEDALPQGIIHGDLFADNLLFRRGKVVGVLDFEAACQGTYVYDLATAVNALCYLEGRYVRQRCEALLSGYQSERVLSPVEKNAFPSALRFSTLRFTVTRLKDFFLRPMENALRVNKDFREFYTRLLTLRRGGSQTRPYTAWLRATYVHQNPDRQSRGNRSARRPHLS